MPFRLRSPRITVSESGVAKACKELLWIRGWQPERLPVGNFKTLDDRYQRYGRPGCPDFLCAHRAYPAFYLETKRSSGGVLSQAQLYEHARLYQGWGLRTVTVRSVEELDRWLNDYEKENAPRVQPGARDLQQPKDSSNRPTLSR